MAVKQHNYTFQESKVWDGRNEPDPKGESKTVRATSADEARSKLPDPETGRQWVLTKEPEIEENTDAASES